AAPRPIAANAATRPPMTIAPTGRISTNTAIGRGFAGAGELRPDLHARPRARLPGVADNSSEHPELHLAGGKELHGSRELVTHGSPGMAVVIRQERERDMVLLELRRERPDLRPVDRFRRIAGAGEEQLGAPPWLQLRRLQEGRVGGDAVAVAAPRPRGVER